MLPLAISELERVSSDVLERTLPTSAFRLVLMLRNALIKGFLKLYPQVDMTEAERTQPEQYGSFNDFFTRALKSGARPIAQAEYVCPVDGAISQLGPITGDQIFQAKGHSYSTTALVGGDAALAAPYANGAFATIYLSPKDYHRIHMPCDGALTRMIYVPGDLYSVNPLTARHVPGLFARNERVTSDSSRLAASRTTLRLTPSCAESSRSVGSHPSSSS